MHIAQIFKECHLLVDESSFTRDFRVRRRWPIMRRGSLDSTFFKKPVLVRYDIVRQKFQYCLNIETVSEKCFMDMEERYLQDSAWKYSTSTDVLPLEAEKVKTRQVGKNNQKYALRVRFSEDQNIRSCHLQCVKVESVSSPFKATLLRV